MTGQRRILITNCVMEGYTGTEMYIRDVAKQLLQRGDRPVIYSTQLGPLADQLRKLSIPVVDNLDQIAEPPDLIHGHHILETMAALLRFPTTPGIYVCHDGFSWHSHIPNFPRLYRYVAVDTACFDRINLASGIPQEKIEFIQNGVDLNRFKSRSPLPSRPGKALAISNYMKPSDLSVIRDACASIGVTVDGVGKKMGKLDKQPEKRLGEYDIVFAKGRCAWEALAVGAAVVVCDRNACGPMVRLNSLEHQASCNFGRRLLTSNLTREALLLELKKYDAQESGTVSQRIRKRASLRSVVGQLSSLYDEVISQHSESPPVIENDLLATSEILQWWSAQWMELAKSRQRSRSPSVKLKKLAGRIANRMPQKNWLRRSA